MPHGHLIPHGTPKGDAGATSTSKQGQCYKRLERHFQRGEFHYNRLMRQGNLAVYSQTWRGCSQPSITFEVVSIRRHNGKEIKGQWVEPSEFYPSASEWGKYGFSFTNKDAAFAKLGEISGRPTRSRKETAVRAMKSRGDNHPQLAANCRKAVQIRREKEKAEKQRETPRLRGEFVAKKKENGGALNTGSRCGEFSRGNKTPRPKGS